MKIIMVAVISKDGFITKGTDPDVSKWSSTEDKDFFAKIKSEHSLFVMGSKTFDSGTVKPNPNTLKVVLTNRLDEYINQEIPGQLEFKNLSAQEFKDKYDSIHATCLLLGGGYTYTEFLEANLVNEIYLTVEPIELKSGTSLLSNGRKLEEILILPTPTKTILNNSGTAIYHFKL